MDILNNTMYAGSTTNKLTINSITNTMNGYKYRVLDKIGNSCVLLSNDTTVNRIYKLPTVNNVTIIQ
jgi:hypothetical protein